MLASRALPLLLAAGLRGSFAGNVINLELYRAVRSEDVQRSIENADMASLPGVLSFLHTEVVGEHFPQDMIPGSRGPTPKPGAGTTGGGSGLGDDDDEMVGGGQAAPAAPGLEASLLVEEESGWGAADVVVGLLSADDVMLEDEHPHQLDPVAEAAGATVDAAPQTSRSGAFLGASAAAPAGDKPDSEESGSRRRVRSERHRGVEVIFRADVKVKNPPKMLASKQVSNVDFGPEISFENGEARTESSGSHFYKWDYGDFVGAAKHVDVRTPQMIPGYWFSFSGSCPNVPWADKHKGGKKPDFMNPQCMVHPSGTGYLKGGLCGTGPDVLPTGEIGCTYTYTPPVPNTKDVLKLDDLVGITQEDCGGRPCRDWKDFREACTNEEYKKVFNYGRRRTLQKAKYCIEYDIHPACVKSCQSKECKALRESDKEVGLPFWRGRCNASASLNRTEQLAVAFEIPGAKDAHETVSPKIRESAQTCLTTNHSQMCNPNADTGFMYCTRHWSGVCQGCRIPGTVKRTKDADQQIMCPWDVLQSEDYAGAEAPNCRTSNARDLCCLYSGTCNVTVGGDPVAAAQTVPLDEDGYTAMSAARSTDGMKAFLYRYHHELFGGELVDEDGLTTFSYWEWGTFPQLGHSFDKAVKGSKRFFIYPTTTTTTTVTTRTTTTRTGTTRPRTLRPTTTAEQEERSACAGPGARARLGLLLAALAAAKSLSS